MSSISQNYNVSIVQYTSMIVESFNMKDENFGEKGYGHDFLSVNFALTFFTMIAL